MFSSLNLVNVTLIKSSEIHMVDGVLEKRVCLMICADSPEPLLLAYKRMDIDENSYPNLDLSLASPTGFKMFQYLR